MGETIVSFLLGIGPSAAVGTRAATAGVTGGLANPIVAILEAIGALVVTITTIVIPAIMGILILIVVFLLLRIVIPKFKAIRSARNVESKASHGEAAH